MQNNEVKPTLSVVWDEEIQDVRLLFDRTEFRTWNWVLALLEMARSKAEDEKRVALAKAMQQQQQQAVQLPGLRRNL